MAIVEARPPVVAGFQHPALRRVFWQRALFVVAVVVVHGELGACKRCRALRRRRAHLAVDLSHDEVYGVARGGLGAFHPRGLIAVHRHAVRLYVEGIPFGGRDFFHPVVSDVQLAASRIPVAVGRKLGHLLRACLVGVDTVDGAFQFVAGVAARQSLVCAALLQLDPAFLGHLLHAETRHLRAGLPAIVAAELCHEGQGDGRGLAVYGDDLGVGGAHPAVGFVGKGVGTVRAYGGEHAHGRRLPVVCRLHEAPVQARDGLVACAFARDAQALCRPAARDGGAHLARGAQHRLVFVFGHEKGHVVGDAGTGRIAVPDALKIRAGVHAVPGLLAHRHPVKRGRVVDVVDVASGKCIGALGVHVDGHAPLPALADSVEVEPGEFDARHALHLGNRGHEGGLGVRKSGRVAGGELPALVGHLDACRGYGGYGHTEHAGRSVVSRHRRVRLSARGGVGLASLGAGSDARPVV